MSSLNQLYQDNVRIVYGFFMSKTMHKQTAEDLTSDVFTAAIEHLRNPTKEIEDPQKYIYGIMKITWTQYLRRKHNQPVVSVEDIEDFMQYAVQSIENYKTQSYVDRAAPFIRQLPDKQRQVLELRFMKGFTLSEIANELSKDMNYVKTTQKRGLASLKRLVNEGESV